MKEKKEVKMSKIVITGGLGFIFSYVTEYFVSKGYEVIVIDNMGIGSHPEIINDTFKLYPLNCASRKAREVIIKENPEYIIHASAISDVDQSIREPGFVLEQNCNANINVFEAARHCSNLKKLLYIGTDEVYGECSYLKTEEDIIFPKNPYSVSKAHGSLIRIAYDSTYPNLTGKTCETRFCNVFGERQDSRKVLARIKEGYLKDEPIPVHNEGKGYREYIYVKNIPEVVELVLLKGHRVYNITTNSGFIVQDLIKKCEEITGKPLKKIPYHRSGMDMIYQMSSERIKTELGWIPKYTFEESLRDYLEGI